MIWIPIILTLIGLLIGACLCIDACENGGGLEFFGSITMATFWIGFIWGVYFFSKNIEITFKYIGF